MYFVPSIYMCIDQSQLGIKDYATLGLVIEAKKTMNKSLYKRDLNCVIMCILGK